jgi:hypothetical protein
MKITDVKLLVLEDLEAKGRGGHSIVRVGGLRRIQYTQQGSKGGGPLRVSFLEMHADEGIEDGHIAPPDGPGWGAQWAEERFRSLVVEEYSYDRCI